MCFMCMGSMHSRPSHTSRSAARCPVVGWSAATECSHLVLGFPRHGHPCSDREAHWSQRQLPLRSTSFSQFAGLRLPRRFSHRPVRPLAVGVGHWLPRRKTYRLLPLLAFVRLLHRREMPSVRSFEVFGRFENSHGRFEIFGRFEVSKTGHFATGHFTHHAKSDTSHFRWREIGHFEHTFEIGHFEHGARHSLRVSGAASESPRDSIHATPPRVGGVGVQTGNPRGV